MLTNIYPPSGTNSSMDSISVILSSNRGSYTHNPTLQTEFDSLKLNGTEGNCFTDSDLKDFDSLNRFIKQQSGKMILGFIGYEAGYQIIEQSDSRNPSLNDVPQIWLIAVEESQIIKNVELSEPKEPEDVGPIKMQQIVSREEYFETVNTLKKHIQLGDIYEINYCIPFVAENVEPNVHTIWKRLQKISPMPFAAMIDHPDFTIISASPERFIKKQGEKIFVQPMKGTSARGFNEQEDERLRRQLKMDKKEQSENVMIVDLTRNDLSKISKKGSVKVDELFGVYSFKSVHQMVSTVSCDLKPEIGFTDILKATFPMGSMTGAPKKKAMQLIEQNEVFKRGPFSGTLGYIDKKGDFDFSVMIRTIFYSKKQKKLFIAVGSAITSGSVVEKEYEECLIKLQPLLQALNATIK